MLRKHFRSYQELISYSSQTFYGSQLQAIKIRGVPLEEVIRFDPDRKMGYVRQLWIYEYLMYRRMQDDHGLKLRGTTYNFGEHAVKSGFYSFRDPKNLIANPLELTEELAPVEFIAKSEVILTDILNVMLDPDVPFRKTEDLNTCKFCDFTGICGR